LLDSIGSVFNVISSHGPTDVNVPTKFTRKFSLKNKTVAVTVAAFDAKSGRIERISELFAPRSNLQTVNILILNRCDAGIIGSIAKKGVIDCLVCPAESDEAMVVSDPNERPLVVSVGRYGKYVGRLQIRAGEVGDKLKLSFLPVPVTEDLRRHKPLVELYKEYQRLVKEANFLEKQSRYVLPNGLKYTGSESCKPCHKYEYEKWSSKAHAHAYATLEKVGSQFDPECVVCHVVGMEYVSGFVSGQKTGCLKNVGCESCHGPGSEHIRTLGRAKTTGPKMDCADCHTPETSGEYAGSKEIYFEKIIHWREPNATGDVK
jgi:nitrate/TMAO reductase-like tetraheme cytochrome c subunit